MRRKEPEPIFAEQLEVDTLRGDVEQLRGQLEVQARKGLSTGLHTGSPERGNAARDRGQAAHGIVNEPRAAKAERVGAGRAPVAALSADAKHHSAREAGKLADVREASQIHAALAAMRQARAVGWDRRLSHAPRLELHRLPLGPVPLMRTLPTESTVVGGPAPYDTRARRVAELGAAIRALSTSVSSAYKLGVREAWAALREQRSISQRAEVVRTRLAADVRMPERMASATNARWALPLQAPAAGGHGMPSRSQAERSWLRGWNRVGNDLAAVQGHRSISGYGATRSAMVRGGGHRGHEGQVSALRFEQYLREPSAVAEAAGALRRSRAGDVPAVTFAMLTGGSAGLGMSDMADSALLLTSAQGDGAGAYQRAGDAAFRATSDGALADGWDSLRRHRRFGVADDVATFRTAMRVAAASFSFGGHRLDQALQRAGDYVRDASLERFLLQALGLGGAPSTSGGGAGGAGLGPGDWSRSDGDVTEALTALNKILTGQDSNADAFTMRGAFGPMGAFGSGGPFATTGPFGSGGMLGKAGPFGTGVPDGGSSTPPIVPGGEDGGTLGGLFASLGPGAANAALAAYSIYGQASKQGVNVGNLLSSVATGIAIGGPIGGAVGGLVDVFGGLFGHHHRSAPQPPPVPSYPGFWNAPSDMDYWAYRYRATGSPPPWQIRTPPPVTVQPAAPVIHVHVYSDGVRRAVEDVHTSSASVARASIGNGYLDGRRPI